MAAALAIDQLHVDAQPVAAALHASLQRIAHIQVAADFSEVDRLALVRKRGVARDYERARNARQIGGETLGNAVGEIFLLVIAAEIGEGEHDNG